MKKILVTGGTGTIGKALSISRYVQGDEVTIFSRNEHDQVEMKREHPYFTYIIGDVRDYNEVLSATRWMDYVFHFAALKHVNICEEQPQEAIKSNVLGTMNVVNACVEMAARMVNMSSDKAINPVNVYGATKFMAENIVLKDRFTNIRSGNVLWSSGSVLPIWKSQIETDNCINITSSEMTRFFVNKSELIKFMWDKRDESGTFTIPMKSFRLADIAKEFIRLFGDKKTELNIVGLRPGERLHEYRDDTISSEENISEDLNYIFND